MLPNVHINTMPVPITTDVNVEFKNETLKFDYFMDRSIEDNIGRFLLSFRVSSVSDLPALVREFTLKSVAGAFEFDLRTAPRASIPYFLQQKALKLVGIPVVDRDSSVKIIEWPYGSSDFVGANLTYADEDD